MHAAASYGHLDILEFLISRGGDVNITDTDGDTPLYTVENIETARFLVDRGAVINRRNSEGISPIEHLTEDFPSVARFLESLSPSLPDSRIVEDAPTPPSQHHQNAISEQLTSELMASVQGIMERAEAEGRDPEDELRQVVSRTVLEGVVSGFEMTTNTEEEQRGPANDSPSKRPKTDDGPE
ncbi:hypothetical protein BDZ94DRAFT_1247255 [Collybia nuda]|uniref:Ankyrin n=1 Tax=Collybia nuda TaxID=64659 RepID=A0A9P6CPZ6_9AGAR|nr:hypothetical protein BDZ94DRAFT_1247255 [Collybia nuda]